MTTTHVQARLHAALTRALSSRDDIAIAAVRSALTAIANAEAIAPAQAGRTPPTSEHVAGAVAGLGAAEAARRELAEADVAAIVTAEISERRAAADDYERLGRADRSVRLRREADILSEVVTAGE